MADQDLINLYSGKILEAAASIPLTKRLDDADASVKKRAPLCGSTVTVDIKVADGEITAFGQDVKACALGQASASVLGSVVIGRNLTELQEARAGLNAMLTENAPGPEAPFDALKMLIPAREFKNRHASILLALDATIEAFKSLD